MRSNVPLLTGIAHAVAPLLDELVFVGGATTELFLTSPAARPVRPTTDVDVICEVRTHMEYQRLGARLRELGFREDLSEGAPLCRWRAKAGTLDVMPESEAILGFSNRWYAEGIRSARRVTLEGDLAIRVVSPPIFLATKLAAFAGRGRGDLLGSHDIEDIITVVAYRAEIAEEVAASDEPLRRWIAATIDELVEHPDAENAIAGALPETRSVPGLLDATLARLRELSSTA
jgi:hypothetical protein